ncbi:hypothetical protein [Ectopseudomonas mendocina]|nr:hypothetical protein [Pseudomonas mendocina]
MPIAPEQLDDNYAIGKRLGALAHELEHIYGFTVLVQKRLEAGDYC